MNISTLIKIEKYLKVLMIILSIIIIISLGLNFYQSVLEPSYNSYLTSCKPQLQEELFGEKYTTVGQTSKKGNEVTINISEEIPEKLRLEVNKHELIHVNQFQRGENLSCKRPIKLYFMEIEAYVGQNIPDWLFYKIYSSNKNNC